MYKITIEVEGDPEAIRNVLREIADKQTFASFYSTGGHSDGARFFYTITGTDGQSAQEEK